jgi:hypothetical protein
MATTKVSTIFVAGLSTTTRFVEHFVVECYSNVGLTTLISQGIAKVCGMELTSSKKD